MRHLIPLLALIATPVCADQISIDELVALPPVQVHFLGELHDNPWHHENQTKAVAAISPKAIVFEMLSPEQAALVPTGDIPDEASLNATLGWADSSWPDFAMYYPIFKATEGAAFYGALVPRDQVRDVIMSGDVAAGFGDGAERYGLTQTLAPKEQAQREAGQLEAHCNALPADMLPGMVMGQRLRDASLARQIDIALDETGGPVVVITGNGHARTDWGAPRMLSVGTSQRSFGQFETPPEEDPPFDYWIVTPRQERGDPCAAFSDG